MVGAPLQHSVTTAETEKNHQVRRQPYLAALASVSALLLSVALLLMGNGLQATLIPVRGSLEGFLAYELGVLGSSYFIGFTFGCICGPVLIGRSGHIRVYLAMVSAASAVALLHALLLDQVIWWLLRAVTGFCFAVLFIIIESWLNERSTNETRGTIFSIYVLISLTVISIGQMMLALDDPKALSLFALVSILVSLAAMPVALTATITPEPVPTVRPRLHKLYGTSPVGFMGCLAFGLTSGAFWALGPVFAQDRGFDTLSIGLFMSAVVLGGALAQWPLGWVSDHMDRRHVILIAALAALSAAVALMTYSNVNQNVILVLALTFGMGAFPVYTLSVAHANDFAVSSDYVEVSSGLLLVFGIGASIGPVVAGFLRHTLPGPTLFMFTASMHLALILFVVWRLRKRDRPSQKERVDFSDVLIAAETVLPLEPLSDPNETPETRSRPLQ